ncbi:MAG: hypothetical protein ABWZ79_04015 [Pedobacter agri]
MDDQFRGHPILMETYHKYVGDRVKIKDTYRKGLCLRFQGNLGLGKTMTACNLLKKVLNSGLYSALYVSLNDIITHLLHGKPETKVVARQLLLMRDFLVIDEFDPRFASSGTAFDLFARILEDVFRSRTSNFLPTFLCTNSPNFELAIASDEMRASIQSLMNYMQDVDLPPGKDLRKEKK